MSIYNRKFGCELEFSTPWKDVHKVIKRMIPGRRLKAKEEWFKSNNNYKQWHLKLDSTTECELCSPISTYRRLRSIVDIIRRIKKTRKIKVTRNDGFHVHIDAHDLDHKQVLALWIKYENVIFGMFPKYRRHSMFCAKAVTHASKNKLVANYFKDAIYNSEDHHYSISFYSFKKRKKKAKRKTIEIRIAEGTIEPRFVRYWTLFCLYFLEATKKCDIINTMCDDTTHDLHDLIEELNITDQNVINWMEERYDQFGGVYIKHMQKEGESEIDSNLV